jgi:hypothetical protein
MHKRLSRNTWKSFAAACAVAGLLGAHPAQAQDKPRAQSQIGDVFYIVMENHNFTQPSSDTSAPAQILGNAAAPYLNSLVTPGNANAAQVSYASAYHNVLSTPSGTGVSIHPSEPNYVWAEAGTNGPLNDNDPYPSNVISDPNLSGLLQSAGIAWKSYQEDIDLSGSGSSTTSTVLPQGQWTVPLTSLSGTSSSYTNLYNGSDQFFYACKHNGPLFFADTNGGNDATTSNPEVSHYAPLQQLGTDLVNNTVGRYNLITPDIYNDMHTGLTGGFTYHGVLYTGDQAGVAQGDNFLSVVVPQIMASQAYQHNGVIVIWNDETEGTDQNDFTHTITEIVISPLAKGNAYDSTVDYTHSSDLKTFQQVFGVAAPGGGYLGDANSFGISNLSDLFQPGVIPAWAAASVSTGADGFTRLLWTDADGTASVWKVSASGQLVTQQQFGPYSGWTAKAIATGPDNQTRLLWTNADGTAAYYLLDSNNAFVSQQQYGPYSGWTAQGLAVQPDNTTRALWTNTDGTATVWTLDSAVHLTTQQQYGPYSGWTAQSLATDPDGTERLLWDNTSGAATFWKLSSTSQMTGQQQYGPYSGYTASAIASAPDGTGRVVWAGTDGHIALWSIDANNTYTGQQTQFGPYTGWSFRGLGVGADGNARLVWDNISGQGALWGITASGSFSSDVQFGPY